MSATQSGAGTADPGLTTANASIARTPVSEKTAGNSADILLIAAAIVSIVVGTILWSSQKLAWTDEVFTWNELRDPSLPHLLRAALHGVDGGMPLFYISGWLWCHTFGDGVLTLRLYSCLGFCLALVLVWRTLRRSYGVWPTAVGVLGTWCTSNQLLNQCAEARFYGLYFVAFAAAMWVTVRLAETEYPSPRLLVAGLVCQASLVLTQAVALLFGVLLIVTLMTCDRLCGRSFRWRVYFSQAVGWLSLLLWLPAIRAVAAAGKPHGWIERPSITGLLGCLNFGFFGSWMILVSQTRFKSATYGLLWTGLCVVVFALTVQAILETFRRKPTAEQRANPQWMLTIFGLVLLTAPWIVFLFSEVGTPIFVPRYVLPSLIGYTILLTRYASTKFSAFRSRKWLHSGLLLFLLITPLVQYETNKSTAADSPDVEVAAIQAMPASLGPVVVGNLREFLPLMRYSEPANQQRFVYLLDWQSALKEYLAAVPDYHLMLAYKQNGYFADRILFANDFLCSHDRFAILDAPTTGWFDTAIRSDPHYRWQLVEVLDKDRSVFEVIRISLPPACSRP